MNYEVHNLRTEKVSKVQFEQIIHYAKSQNNTIIFYCSFNSVLYSNLCIWLLTKKYQLQRMSLISRQTSFNVHIHFLYDLHVQIFYIYNFSLLFLKN